MHLAQRAHNFPHLNRTRCFRLGLKPFLHTFLPWLMPISDADSPVVPDTLIDLLLNLNTCYIRWPPRMLVINTRPPPPLVSLHSSGNFPLAHTVIAISSVFTLSDHESRIIDRLFLAHSVNGAATLTTRKTMETGSKWWKVHIVYIPYFSVLPTSLLK
jgi:hypothetical protein